MAEGSPWRLLIPARAEREIKRLSPIDEARVRAALDRLARDLISQGRKLRGKSNEWRIRVGPIRIRYERDVPARTIIVLRVLPRGRSYRD